MLLKKRQKADGKVAQTTHEEPESEHEQATLTTLGLILAGGLSTRMGGGDKGLRLLHGKPILAHVIERMRPQVQHLALNANGDPIRFADYGLSVIADDVPGYAGPLAGVLAGMDQAAADGHLHLLSVAADCPFLPHDLGSQLSTALHQNKARISVARSGGWDQPTIAIWDVGLRHHLRAALTTEGLRKIDRFTARYPLASVEWSVEPVDPFFNVNTPEDLALAEQVQPR
jgi:molybdenum cofactor guanylyltransferase